MDEPSGNASVVLYVNETTRSSIARLARQIDGGFRGKSRTAGLFLEWAGRAGMMPRGDPPGKSPLHLRLDHRFSAVRPVELAAVLDRAVATYTPHPTAVMSKKAETRLIPVPKYDVNQIAIDAFARQEPFIDVFSQAWRESLRQVHADLVSKIDRLGYQTVEIMLPLEDTKLYDNVDERAGRMGWDADTLIASKMRTSVPRRQT
jgi:hypothetical protein